MARPGLQQLLADVAAGKVDVIVVYKVDRLTRSLADFARIVDTLEPVLNQHRLVIDAAAARKDSSGDEESRFSLLYQLTHITKERGSLRHDDVLDALAHGVAYFRDQLARDTDRAEQHYRTSVRRLASWRVTGMNQRRAL